MFRRDNVSASVRTNEYTHAFSNCVLNLEDESNKLLRSLGIRLFRDTELYPVRTKSLPNNRNTTVFAHCLDYENQFLAPYFCRGTITVSFETHTKHRITLLWQIGEFSKVIVLLHKVPLAFPGLMEVSLIYGQFCNWNAVLFGAEIGVFTCYSIQTGWSKCFTAG
jgi:hypothetical protein